MPRQLLREISGHSNYRGGIRGRFELTPNWRSHIVGRAVAGQCQKAISGALKLQYNICTIDQADSRYENESPHQSGHPRTVNGALNCRILREVRANPKIRYTNLQRNLDFHGKAY